jgi:endonuclease/exonuclease/phosphatase family metal-dependent hydrolase
MDLRLVSFNIQNRKGEHPEALTHRMKACAAYVQSLQPDLLCLQEVTPDAYAVLKNKLRPVHHHFQPRKENFTRAEGVPILLMNDRLQCIQSGSFWFSTSPEISSKSWQAAHPRICSWMQLSRTGATDLWIFNLHLDHRSRRARRRSLHLLQEKIRHLTSPEDALLVCGDFNMPGTRKEIRHMAKQDPPLLDATRTHPIGFLRPTYLGWGPWQLAKARIDLCLHSARLQIDEYHARDPKWESEQISDHRALQLTISDPPPFSTESVPYPPGYPIAQTCYQQ